MINLLNLRFMVVHLLMAHTKDDSCIQLKGLNEAREYLRVNGRIVRNYDQQLETNSAFVYRLNTGEVLMIPGALNPNYPCLLFSDKNCFERTLESEIFPVESDDKQIEEYDVEGIKMINKNIDKYQQYLNRKFGLTLSGITEYSVEQYFFAVKRKRKRDPLEIIALGAVMGESLRLALNGKWALIKRYGTYNPYYVPQILFDDDKLLDVLSLLIGDLQSKNGHPQYFFNAGKIFFESKAIFEKAGVGVVEL